MHEWKQSGKECLVSGVPERGQRSHADMFSSRLSCVSTGTDFVLGSGHSIHSLLEYQNRTGRPVKLLLDDYVRDRSGKALPAVILEETSHSAWANSLALEKAGLTSPSAAAAANGEGSIYMTLNGELSGILLENAGNKIMEQAFDPVAHPALKDLALAGLNAALADLAASGLTSVVDAR